ncbi:MAG: heme lyase CcmF/NrfE family subunit [Gammaproteobacteria bacterium]|jgi:cytochrome c-type biogenesis protein CcmF|nr:heme lyase CcmF/NrfE family subunit [Gammaproteobacteria bacterium]
MCPEIGLFCLILAFMMALVQTILPPIGLAFTRFTFLQSLSRPAVFAQCFFVLMSFVTLVSSFVQDDFSVAYIAHNSNTQLPLIYKFCATWGAHEGSLLLWSMILAFWSLAVAVYSKKLPKEASIVVLSILGAISIGFFLLLLQTSNPFLRLLPFSPTDGADLNPLLQDPGFVIHPPCLYMGYVGFAVPFAFAICAMVFKKYSTEWVKWARPWALLAWGFLTIGITLGSWWAYYELGWGGWWFWDPVENASFMPWLIGAALCHALLVSNRNQSFIPWSVLLALSAFILSLIGTFLVRSGVISSVHAFASDPARGSFILCFLAIVIMGSCSLYLGRGLNVKAKPQSSLLSRESMMLLGNIVLFVSTLTVLLGTIYPIFLEVIQQERISVGAPYFNMVFIPLMLPILVLMIFAPHLQWQGNQLSLLWPHIKKLCLILLMLLIAIFFLPQSFTLLSTIGILLGSGVIIGTLYKLMKMAKDQNMFRFPLSRWSMIIAHVGLGVSVLGIALTTSLETEKEINMMPSETVEIQGYQFTFKNEKGVQGSNYEGLQAEFIVRKNSQIVATLFPEKRYFIPRNLPMTETAISPGLLRDFYIALGERSENGNWSVRIYIKPFVRWIWLGGLLVAIGAFFASIDAFRKNQTRL